ncbi:MAG TPA: putative solute-binding protein, partial [Moraxellaceae bacterium]
RFPAGFAASLRQRAPAFVDTSLATIKAAEAALPAQYWLDLGDAERQHYQQLLASARDQLTQEGFYDPRMMALLHKLRCRADPAGSEGVLGLR